MPANGGWDTRNPADLGNCELPGSDGEASCRTPWQALALSRSAGGSDAAGPLVLSVIHAGASLRGFFRAAGPGGGYRGPVWLVQFAPSHQRQAR